jgi:DUF4097 and DUF4098 domain-containing protein YvlB
MKILFPFCAVATLLLLPVASEAKITRTVEKTFSVQPGGHLTAATQGGDITIRTGDTATVQVTAKQVIRASTENEADELLANLELKLEQQGNDVTATAKYEKNKAGFNWGQIPVTVSFTIVVPRQYDLQLNTSGGDIAVADLTGKVRARTSGGDLNFARIDGDLDASTSGGDVFLREGTARTKLSTSGGDVVVERAGGPTEVSTSGGDITLNAVKELISANTSGGDIKAVLTGPLSQNTTLSTSGGDIRVTLPKGTGLRLDASTSGGSVDASGLTITIEKGGSGKHSLVGAVNGGGPLLKVRTSGGEIKVRTE